MGEYKTANAWNDLFKSEAHCENFLSTLKLKKSATHFKATKIPLPIWFAALYQLGTNHGKLKATVVARHYKIEIKAAQRLLRILKQTMYKGQIPLERVKQSKKGRTSQGFIFEIAPDCICDWYYFRLNDNLLFTSVEQRQCLKAVRGWEARESDRAKTLDQYRASVQSIESERDRELQFLKNEYETEVAKMKENKTIELSDAPESSRQAVYSHHRRLGMQRFEQLRTAMIEARKRADSAINKAYQQFTTNEDPHPLHSFRSKYGWHTDWQKTPYHNM